MTLGTSRLGLGPCLPAIQYPAQSLAQRHRGRWLNWPERGSTLGKFIKLCVGKRRPERANGVPEVTQPFQNKYLGLPNTQGPLSFLRSVEEAEGP